MANRVSVINSFYRAPHSNNLQINTEKGATYNENDDRLFYTEDTFFTLHERRVLYDDTQNPIVTFYNKVSLLMHVAILILTLISFVSLIFTHLQK